ncbi:MAG: FAD-dependent oxidoreductase [Muribaculaceae bacterium]|nr:FAD-dependent oxidoreductase [Muribaculaceae bacterium]
MSRKCVIIGSGLGGLSCGVILARNGFDVTVLEQGAQPGGCLQCFTRHGAKFDTGMHFIGSAAPGQTLNRLMRYLGIDDVPLSPLDPTGYDIVSLAGEEFRFANGRDAFIGQMVQYFPAERQALNRYFDIVQQISEASSLHTLREADSVAPLDTHYQTVSMNAVLEELFPRGLLANVIAGNLPLYAARRDRTPFSQHAFIMDFYNPSAYRIPGGSDSIARGLQRAIEQAGGRVLTRSKATRIVCDSTRATAVEINGSELLDADVVIAAIHPARAMELLDTKLIRPAFRSRLSSLPNTTGGFSVYLKFKPGAVPYLNSNYYHFNSDSPWGCEDYTATDWPKGWLYMHFPESASPQWASTGVILSYMDMADVAAWGGTSVGRRGKDYETFKDDKARRLIDDVVRRHPALAGGIEAYYTSTPLTYLDYTGTEGGSMYGVAKDITLGPAGRVPHRTRVPNVLLSGQNINSHGMLGTLVGTLVTCSELLSPAEIYNQISQSTQ